MPGDLELSRFEATIKFETEAMLPFWSGNTLRSGFGARLRDMVCLGSRFGPAHLDSCDGCPSAGVGLCAYDFFYNSRPPEGSKVLRKQEDIPRPFSFEPPRPGRYMPGERATLGFSLFGKGMAYLPYFLLAVRNLGESGLSKGYREGLGRFALESVDSLGYGIKSRIFSGDTVYNRSMVLKYSEMLKASEEHSGDLVVKFTTPAQIKENGVFTAAPSFRGLVSKLLFRANALAEFYGSGMLYDRESSLDILGQCRQVAISSARVEEVRMDRCFHNQSSKKVHLPPFFRGELTFAGDFSRDIMALLELGRIIHVGKMATFGNGGYEVLVH